jgi:hypothetical protein
MDIQRIHELERTLYDLLGPQLQELTQLVASNDKTYLVEIPDGNFIDLPYEELASLVARSSNIFGRVSRYAGMARAEYKLSKGRYDRQYKKSRTGKNDAERDKNAMDACDEEHLAMVTMEAIAELADAMENAARIASESSRKLLDKAQNMSIAQSREERGQFRTQDFKTY